MGDQVHFYGVYVHVIDVLVFSQDGKDLLEEAVEA